MKTTPTPWLLALIDKPQNGRGFFDAKSRSRLVEDQHFRAEIHRSADRDNLALAAGQSADQLVAVAHPGDAKFPYLLERDAVASLGVEPTERRASLFQLRAKKEIASHAHERNRSHLLVDGGDAARTRVARISEAGLLPVKVDRAAARRMKPGQDLDQRRLAGAVVSQEAHDLARMNGDRNVGQRLHPGEVLADVAQFDERLGHGRHVPTGCSSRSGGSKSWPAPRKAGERQGTAAPSPCSTRCRICRR